MRDRPTVSCIIAVTFFFLCALAARAAHTLVLEAILGTLIMALAGGILVADLTELQYRYGLPYHFASMAAVLLGGGAYALYRRRCS